MNPNDTPQNPGEAPQTPPEPTTSASLDTPTNDNSFGSVDAPSNEPTAPSAQPAFGAQPASVAPPSAPVESAQPQQFGAPQPPQQNGNKKKLVTIIAIVVVALLLAVAGVVAYVLSQNNDDAPAAQTESTSEITESAPGPQGDVVDRPDGTLDLSSLINAQDSITEQDLTGDLLQQINLSDGFSFLVAGVTTLESYTRTIAGEPTVVTAEAGNEIIAVQYVVGNRATEGEQRYSLSTFDVKNADTDEDYRAVQFLSSDPILPEGYFTLDLPDLEPGQQQAFTVYYEVPAGASLIAVKEDSFRNSASGEEIRVAGTVTLR